MSQSMATLPDWVKEHVNALYKAKNADEFDTAFDDFISHNVSIKVNGKPMSSDQYKKMIMGEIKDALDATMSYNGVVSVSNATKDRFAPATGTVGAFFKANFETVEIYPSEVTSSMNVVVCHDTSIVGVDNDNRRVTNIDEVLDFVHGLVFPPQQQATTA